MRIRHFQDERGNGFETQLEGCLVRQTAGRRLTEKSFPSEREAWAYCQKEELNRLRKGFVGRDQGFVRNLGRAYTGAMVIQFHQGQLITNFFDEASSKDELLRFDLQGNLLERRTLPGLLWELADFGKELALKVDHSVLLGGRTLCGENSRPASFLSVAAGRVAFYEEPEVVVLDSQGRKLLTWECQPDLYSGHSTQMAGALSTDGEKLAVCYRTGQVELFSLQSGQQTSIPIDACLVKKMAFCQGLLVLAESYPGRVSLVDPDSQTYRPLLEARYSEDLSVDGRELLVPEGSQLRRVALDGQILESRPLDYVVRRARVARCPAGLAIRTDSGCLIFQEGGRE